MGGIEYSGANLEAIYHGEGRCTPNGATAFFYEYTVKDHLGNARVNFRANGAAVTFLEELHYYPFGMTMEGIGTAAVTQNKYRYNGKEMNDDFGLNWSDYGARWYDASLGRWWSVDPLAEPQANYSPYAYALNNPLSFIDPTGMAAEQVGADGLTNSQWMEASRPANEGMAEEFVRENREKQNEKFANKNKKRNKKAEENWKKKIVDPLANAIEETFAKEGINQKSLAKIQQLGEELVDRYSDEKWLKEFVMYRMGVGESVFKNKKIALESIWDPMIYKNCNGVKKVDELKLWGTVVLIPPDPLADDDPYKNITYYELKFHTYGDGNGVMIFTGDKGHTTLFDYMGREGPSRNIYIWREWPAFKNEV